MATWSRSQSQTAGGQRAIGAGPNIKCSSHLARNAKVMAANKRENARVIRWAEEAPGYTKVREYSDTIAVKLSRKAKRKLGSSVLRSSTRVELTRRSVARNEMRRALQDVIDGSKGEMPI